MANSTTSNLSNAVKQYFDKLLLDRLTAQLFYAQFGDKRPLPANIGTTIEFTRYVNFPVNTTPLTEGVPPTARALSANIITAQVAQYGDVLAVTDLLEMTKIDPKLEEQVDIIAYQSSQSVDNIVRDELNQAYASTVQFAGGNIALSNIAATDTMDIGEIRTAKATMLKKDVMPFDTAGTFAATIHPNNEADLTADSASGGWIEANKYVTNTKLHTGEIGKLLNVRFVSTTQVDSNPSGASDADVYDCHFFGKHGFAVTDLAGMGMKLFIKPKGSAGTADPLDQLSTVGWKTTFATKGLDSQRIIRVRAGSALAP